MDSSIGHLGVISGLVLLAISSRGGRAADDFGVLPSPTFHHLHLNSVNPDAAINFYTREFPSTSKAGWGGFQALKSPNDVMILFNKVDKTSGR